MPAQDDAGGVDGRDLGFGETGCASFGDLFGIVLYHVVSNLLRGSRPAPLSSCLR